MTTTTPPHILIVGAGVIGLSTALTLLDSPNPPRVTLLSSNFPTDTTPHPAEYASTWAGAHHVSAPSDEREREWDRETLCVLKSVKSADWCHADALHWVRQSELFANPPVTPAERLAQEALSIYTDVSNVNTHEQFNIRHPQLPHHTAIHFTTLDLNVPVYLSTLYSRFVALGGQSIRARVNSLQEAVRAAVEPPSALFVSPGLGVRSIAELDEKDTTYAVRGQTVRVYAPWLAIPASHDTEHSPTWPGLSRTNEKGERDIYIIPRGGGQYIIGGTRLPHDEDPSPRKETTTAILTRALKICPRLAPPSTLSLSPRPEDVHVLGVNVGFRPARVGGPVLRLREQPQQDGLPPTVLGYGFGGYGYQNSWGVALEARRLLFGALNIPLPHKQYTLESLQTAVPSVEHLWTRRARM